MPATAHAPSRAQAIQAELDQARRSGPLQQIAIPPCPDHLARLRTALGAAEPDLGAVADIASHDVAMSATLVQRANSPRYSAGQPATTVGQALNRLGLDETARVMTAFITRRALPVNSPHLQRFWERSTRRAVAMEFIAGELPGLSPDLAHTFGLFCDVGMPVLLQCMRGYGGTLVEAQARIDRPFIATENANHRTDHAVVGALVCRTWQFDAAVVAAVRLHHDLNTLGGSDTEPEVQTLVAAGLVAEHLMRRAEGLSANREWSDHGRAALDWLALEGTDLEIFEERLQPLFDEVH